MCRSGRAALTVNEAVNDAVNEAVESLYECIKLRPGLNGRKLAATLSRSEPTIDRQVKALKKAGLVEFRGAPKNGGYYYVSDAAMKLVANAETEASKFLLCKVAFGLYIRGKAYDKAADVLETFREPIADLPTADLGLVVVVGGLMAVVGVECVGFLYNT